MTDRYDLLSRYLLLPTSWRKRLRDSLEHPISGPIDVEAILTNTRSFGRLSHEQDRVQWVELKPRLLDALEWAERTSLE